MKGRIFLYIIIGIICISAIILGVYYQIKPQTTQSARTNVQNEVRGEVTTASNDLEEIKEEFFALFDNTFKTQGYTTTNIKRLENFEEQEPVYPAYNIKQEEEGKYDVNLNIPVVNIGSEDGVLSNETTQKEFVDKADEILNNAKQYSEYTINYVAYLNDNILSLAIESTLKEGEEKEKLVVYTYNIDTTTGKAITLNELLEKRGISQKEVNKKITQVIKQTIKETNQIEDELAKSGKTVYKRDIDSAMYVTDNVNYFLLGEDEQLYIIYPYGNTTDTSEIDIIKI